MLRICCSHSPNTASTQSTIEDCAEAEFSLQSGAGPEMLITGDFRGVLAVLGECGVLDLFRLLSGSSDAWHMRFLHSALASAALLLIMMRLKSLIAPLQKTVS